MGEIQEGRLGEKLMRYMEKSNGISVDYLLSWVFYVKNAIKFISDPPNPEGFRKEIQSYKTLRELDKWKLTMFAMAIKNIEHQEDDEDLK